MAEEEKKEDGHGPRLGIFDGIPNEEYHRGPGISKSGLDVINRTPAHYIIYKKHPKPATSAFSIGDGLHVAILQPEIFERDYVADPYPGERTKSGSIIGAQNKDAKEAREELRKQGKVIIHSAPKGSGFWDKDDWRRIHEMRHAVMMHPTASILFDHDSGRAEQSVFWIDQQTGKLCKCRPDFLNDAHNLAVDLKSTVDARFSEFARSAGKFRYHVQGAFYKYGLKSVDESVKAFVFVAVEKEPPYGIGVYKITPDGMHIGRLAYEHDLDKYAQCHRADEWPCYEPDIRDLEIPAWALRGNIS